MSIVLDGNLLEEVLFHVIESAPGDPGEVNSDHWMLLEVVAHEVRVLLHFESIVGSPRSSSCLAMRELVFALNKTNMNTYLQHPI
jgi:hypothetical protein